MMRPDSKFEIVIVTPRLAGFLKSIDDLATLIELGIQ